MAISLAAPEPEPLGVGEDEAAVVLAGEAVDRETCVHKLVPGFAPPVAMETLAVDIGPVERFFMRIPGGALAAEVVLVYDDIHG